MRASKGYLRLAALSMHRDDDLTFAPLFMLVLVKSAAVPAAISEMFHFPLFCSQGETFKKNRPGAVPGAVRSEYC